MLPQPNGADQQPCILKHTLDGHSSGVLSVRITKNGRYLLSASQDKSVKLWNPHSGLHVKTYTGPHNHEVNDVLVTEDNSKFLSCGGDKHFFQWDVTTGQVIRKFTGHERKINAISFGPNEDLVLSASHDRSVRIWDTRARAKGSIQVLTDATDSVLCVCAGGDEITTGSTDGGLRHYDVRRGKTIEDHLLQPIGSISFSRDRQCILASTLDDNIRLLERETGNELARYKDHKNTKFKVQSTLDPKNALVVSGSEDGRLCFWDLADATMISSVKAHDGPVLCVRYSDETMVTSSADGSLKVWDVVSAPLQRSVGGVAALGFTPSDSGLPTSFGRRHNPQANLKRPSRDVDDEGEGTTTRSVAVSAVCSTPQPPTDAAGQPNSAGELEDGEIPQAAKVRKRGDRGKKGKRKDPEGAPGS